jgi:hypothetical protein
LIRDCVKNGTLSQEHEKLERSQLTSRYGTRIASLESRAVGTEFPCANGDYAATPINITSTRAREINALGAATRYHRGVEGSAAKNPKVLEGPPCQTCGGFTRILAITPHPRQKRRHLWMVECTACGVAQEADMPAPRHIH